MLNFVLSVCVRHVATVMAGLKVKMDFMETEQQTNRTSQLFRMIFGIIMVIIYVGMGILLFFNFFQWGENWAWLRWIGAVLFTVYGIWRAYRQFKGIDSSI